MYCLLAVAVSSFRSRCGAFLGRFTHSLSFDQNLHFAPDENPPGFQRLIPEQTKIAAVDLRVRFKACARPAPGILPHAVERRVQRHFLGFAADGQVAENLEAIARLLERASYAFAAERDRRMLVC